MSGQNKSNPSERPQRKRPSHGVLNVPATPTVVFITFCTQNRVKALANNNVHTTMQQIWRDADRWRVGRYILMPDHVHHFASPAHNQTTLDSWVTYCKSMVSRTLIARNFCCQAGHWDTRMRSAEQYETKWEYVRHNAVRHGLVQRAADWPYQGTIFDLAW